MVTVQVPWLQKGKGYAQLLVRAACLALFLHRAVVSTPQKPKFSGPDHGLAEQDSIPRFWEGLQIFFLDQTEAYNGLHRRYNSLGWGPKLSNKL